MDSQETDRREIISAYRFSIVLVLVPVVLAITAFIDQESISGIVWLVITISHIISVSRYFSEAVIFRYVLLLVLFVQSIYLLFATLASMSWFDRYWQLIVALVQLWIIIVLLRDDGMEELGHMHEAVA